MPSLRTQFSKCFLTRIRPSIGHSKFHLSESTKQVKLFRQAPSPQPGKFPTRKYRLSPPEGPPFKHLIRLLVLAFAGAARFSFRNTSERQFPLFKHKVKATYVSVFLRYFTVLFLRNSKDCICSFYNL